MQTLSHCHCLAALELEQPLFLDAGDAATASVFDRGNAEQLTAHLATDLEAMLPGVSRHALALSGALYDPAQLLRPGLPLFSTLKDLLQSSYQGGEFQPRTLSFGSATGRMPAPAMQPDEEIPLGSLVLVPMLLSGPEERIAPLREAMESDFMERGQLSANSITWLQAAIGRPIVHGRFMTLTDLAAMVAMQLESVGLGGLWQLLDQAIFNAAEPLQVQTPAGLDMQWDGQQVLHHFQPFEQWAEGQSGQWQELAGDARLEFLQSGYQSYTLEMRQYLMSLAAHRVPLSHLLPGAGKVADDGSWLVCETPAEARAGAADVTHHATDELGLVAITRELGERLLHYYPLAPGGLEAIQDELRPGLPEDTVMAYPGRLCMDADQARLVPDVRALH